MTMNDAPWIIALAFSEAMSVWLLWRLWRSDDHLFFKISLSVLALLPVLGPLLVLWIGNFPDTKPRVLRDRLPRQADFYARWQHVLEEKNPVRRFRAWRELMTRHRDEDT